MPTPILMTPVTPYQNYCQQSDVENLIGGVITAGAISSGTISTFIDEAVMFLDSETRGFFSPRRLVEKYDGNNTSRMNLAHSPVMAINQVSVFFSYPLALSRLAYDWDLLVDHTSGSISFPTYIASPLFSPFAFTFPASSKNIEVDAWYGYTKQIFAETLATTDYTTYTLANPTAIQQSQDINYPYEDGAPPQFFPVVYKNGVRISNVDYVLVLNQIATANSDWQIEANNLVYSTNYGANGITGFTFNTPNLSTDVITCDYVYWYIPADITLATAKRAAINILSSVASSQFGSNEFNGFDNVQIDGARMQAATGQFGSLITRWSADIEATIKKYRKVTLDYKGGFDVTTIGWLA